MDGLTKRPCPLSQGLCNQVQYRVHVKVDWFPGLTITLSASHHAPLSHAAFSRELPIRTSPPLALTLTRAVFVLMMMALGSGCLATIGTLPSPPCWHLSPRVTIRR